MSHGRLRSVSPSSNTPCLVIEHVLMLNQSTIFSARSTVVGEGYVHRWNVQRITSLVVMDKLSLTKDINPRLLLLGSFLFLFCLMSDVFTTWLITSALVVITFSTMRWGGILSNCLELNRVNYKIRDKLAELGVAVYPHGRASWDRSS